MLRTSYQFSFEEKSDWTSFYACGSEIHQHLEEIAEKYKLMRYIKLQHEVIHAQYDAPTGRWHVRIRRPNAKTGMLEDVEDSAQVLIGAFGVLSRWKWPDIEGLHDFKGELLHSAGFKPYPKTWQEIAEPWTDKKVGVIGAGSSAIQIVAALQPKSIGRDSAADGPEDMLFTQEEIERLKNDPKLARDFRSTVESDFNSVHACTIRGTPQSLQFTEILQESMKRKLMKKPWIAEHLIPSYSAICRRLTPGPGYLEALCADNADFVHSPIKKITDRGIETVSGDFQELDVIICATGYDTSYQLPFPIIGKDGVDINEKWSPHPTSYLSIAVDGFPNMFMSLGPNSAVATGTLIPLIEYQIGYAVQATAKLQRERLKSIEVKAEAVQDFDDYIEAYFPQTVFAEKCRSWYKVGKDDGRVVGLWPGSMLHGMKALIYPRWEDYNYERADPIQNRLYWLGDGQTYNEKTLSGDRAWYLHPPYLDVPPVPEA